MRHRGEIVCYPAAGRVLAAKLHLEGRPEAAKTVSELCEFAECFVAKDGTARMPTPEESRKRSREGQYD